ncbi:hypothetical protein [Streptomyces montanisoli]|uniref:Asp23/Gls24 family envelope stress response protein n=1 Tax=Streptomyces montanisoli TaxID=2798581 RepID=A0A940M9W9_9ACTN|nr:hypothetical protein [Streptomyces montanisoli]MBP0457444.1 hypothetical protein [Streptomyces montanisoli]
MAMNTNPPNTPPWQQDGEEDRMHGDGELLPCGRSLASLWEEWDDGDARSDPHVAECPHCTAALGRLSALQDFVGRATDDGTGAADGAGESIASRTESVTARVMDVVRLELRPGLTLPLGEPEEDSWIVEAAVAKVLRRAAETLPGVRAGSCRVRPVADDHVGAGGPLPDMPLHRPVDVHVELAVSMSWAMPELARQVRGRMMAAADEAVGLDVRTIDVSVIDLLDEEAVDAVAGGESERGARW